MKKIKKIVLCIAVSSTAIIFNGCNTFKSIIEQAKNEIANFSTETNFPSSLETAQNLIDNFNEKNSYLIKESLCKRSQNLTDIEEQIQNAFDFIGGNIISFNEDVNGAEEQSIESGKKTIETRDIIIRDIVTDDGKSFDIYAEENLIYTKDPKRVGITNIFIRNNEDESEISIGYSWQDLYTEGRDIANSSAEALGTNDYSAFTDLLSESILDKPETQENISKTMNFFDGMPYFGKVPGDGLNYAGKHDTHVTVDEEETVENGEPVCIHLTIHCENIETDTGRIFSSEIEAYIQNDSNPELIGITKFILFDEDGNSIIIE